MFFKKNEREQQIVMRERQKHILLNMYSFDIINKVCAVQGD